MTFSVIAAVGVASMTLPASSIEARIGKSDIPCITKSVLNMLSSLDTRYYLKPALDETYSCSMSQVPME